MNLGRNKRHVVVAEFKKSASPEALSKTRVFANAGGLSGAVHDSFEAEIPLTCVTELRPRPRGRRALRGPRDFSPRENAAKGSDRVQPVPASGLRAAAEILS